MKVSLRKWTMEDAGPLARLLNNPKIQANLRDGIPYPYTEDDAAEFLRHTLDAPADSQYSWAVLADGQLAGSIGLYRKDNIHRLTAELGYYIGEEFWGKGVMTQAVRQACDTVFTSTDIVRIFAEPYATNMASCRVLEKAGFRLEGTLRCNAIKDGKLLDMRMYAITNE